MLLLNPALRESLNPAKIAIVGLGGCFPGAGDLHGFWGNIHSGVDAGRSVPKGRWRLESRYALGPFSQPDKALSTWGCFLDETVWSLFPHRPAISQHLPAITEAEWNGLDPLFRLGLKTAFQTIESTQNSTLRGPFQNRPAAPLNLQTFDPARCGVILGSIALPIEAINDLCWDVLGSRYLSKVLDASTGTRSPGPYGSADSQRWSEQNRYALGLPAAIIARELGWRGPAFTLDAACASSIYAVKLAMNELRAGRADVMLAGGLSRPDCQYTQIGFSQLKALSQGQKCRPLDARADGLVVGEGAGMFLLMRLKDAIAAGLEIHAVLVEAGLSNDRGGSLLSPRTEGQLRAMRAAYQRAGWLPESVDLIECHATGTPVGDQVEIASLHELWRQAGYRSSRAVLGAVKSNVGHLLTGAGAAALMKVVLALKHQRLPCTANYEQPAGLLQEPNSPFAVLQESQRWEAPGHGLPRRAAVNGFGFGGINGHLLVEEFLDAESGQLTGSPSTHDPVQVSVAADLQLAQPEPEPVAIIGFSAALGEASIKQLFERWQSRHPEREAAPMENPQLSWPVQRFRIPPVEQQDMLPQQGLMLDVASEAKAHAGLEGALGDRCGLFVGIALDIESSNFHLRWRLEQELRGSGITAIDDHAAVIESLVNGLHPPLTPNRVMGNLGGIVASRVARELDCGGPAFVLSSEEASSFETLRQASEALRLREVDLALACAVDLPDADKTELWKRTLPPNSTYGAGAVVLKRLSDAQRDGDQIYALIENVTSGAGEVRSEKLPPVFPSISALLGPAGVAAGMIDAIAAVACLATRSLPPGAADAFGQSAKGWQYWLKNRSEGARQAILSSQSPIGLWSLLTLKEAPQPFFSSLAATRPHVTELPLVIWPEPQVSGGETGTVSEASPADLATRHQLIERARSLLAAWENSAVNGLSGRHVGPSRWRHFCEVYAVRPQGVTRPLAILMVSSNASVVSLLEQITTIRGQEELTQEGVLYLSATPQEAKLAYLFPGSGSHFLGMGRELGQAFPEILEQQDRENLRLADQYRPDLLWNGESSADIADDHRAMIFGQVTLATLMCDLLARFGVVPQAAIGNSLGESSALFGLRIWTARDEMLSRMLASRLFAGLLTPPFDTARQAWNIPPEEPVPWTSGVVECRADRLWPAIARKPKVALLIVLAPQKCLIGGDAGQVAELLEELSLSITPLPAPSTVHLSFVQQVEDQWRALHLLPVQERPEITVYSTATSKAYIPSTTACAEAITSQALHTIDFPAVIEAALHDGTNLFLEIGPGSTCTRLIETILANRDQQVSVRSACPLTAHPVRHFVRTLAWLAVRGVAVDFAPLFASCQLTKLIEGRRKPLGLPDSPQIEIPIRRLNWKQIPVVTSEVASVLQELLRNESSRAESHPHPGPLPEREGIKKFPLPEEEGIAAERLIDTTTSSATPMTMNSPETLDAAEAAYLAFEERLARLQSEGELEIASHEEVVLSTNSVSSKRDKSTPPRSLSREECLEFAIGKIGEALGPLFAAADQYPTRVRLPDEPLMLVDRITNIEGEPLSMSHGSVVTEHDVHAARWYLDGGRIPTAIAVESGQADLFLAGWLGIDLQTRGLAVYRLLDAIVTFHRGLPVPGETIVYNIRILKFFQQGETWLFKFEFDGTVNGQPLITMREGCAGFFTESALAAGKGIIHSTLDLAPRPGKLPADWHEPVPITPGSLSDAQVELLRQGDLVGAFGQAFAGLPLHKPYTIPGGKLRLVDRVLEIEPGGGKYGLGRIRAALDIHPDDWFLECHFCDDHVMPGTLMYECCLHTLRIYLLRMGWVGETSEVVSEPVVGIESRLKCRGQVLASTKEVWYEVTIRELGYGTDGSQGDAYCLADALMFADGKPIVEISNMSLRFTGLTKARVEAIWAGRKTADPYPLPEGEGIRKVGETNTRVGNTPSYDVRPAIYPLERITAYSIGKPSEAFGPEYTVFDHERKIARLPGPPFQFLDRIVEVGGPPFVMKAGCHCVAQYDVPVDAWYFSANRQPEMPFSVLLETALQPCGWLAAYAGSALTSETDLKFRNLGGKATQHRPVTPEIGTLTTTARMTQASMSGGMIIQHFSMEMFARDEPVYSGTTYFGFFSAASLANQVGLRDARRVVLENFAASESFSQAPPFPEPSYSFVDQITHCLVQQGSVPGRPELAGFVRGEAQVNPAAWYYKAHFYEDPVMPGSLGLEAFLQVIKHWMVKAEIVSTHGGVYFETPVCGTPQAWVYRGQVIPKDRLVTIDAEIVSVDRTTNTVIANGWLEVDGRVIYQMTGWVVRGVG